MGLMKRCTYYQTQFFRSLVFITNLLKEYWCYCVAKWDAADVNKLQALLSVWNINNREH